MSNRIQRLKSWWQSAESSVKIHRWLKWLWIFLCIPTLLFWTHSVPWLVFMSIYAVITGHWSAEQAGKVEVLQEEAEEEKE